MTVCVCVCVRCVFIDVPLVEKYLKVFQANFVLIIFNHSNLLFAVCVLF